MMPLTKLHKQASKESAESVATSSHGVPPCAFGGSSLHLPVNRLVPNRKFASILAIVCSAILLIVMIVGFLLQNQAMVTDFSQAKLPPSFAHPFGTDWMGRDMFIRTIAGLSTSISIGLFAAILSSAIALVLGCAAALGGKWVDAVVCWLVDLLMGVPHIVLLILISFSLGKGFWGVTIGVALTHWGSLTRVVRAEVMQCRSSQYVMAARKFGQSWFKIACTHMLSFVLPQFLVGLVLLFPHAILHEAAITFLGFGLSPDVPAIGIILSESMTYLTTGLWWLAVFPGIALIVVVFLFDAIGSSLRKVVDPFTAQE